MKKLNPLKKVNDIFHCLKYFYKRINSGYFNVIIEKENLIGIPRIRLEYYKTKGELLSRKNLEKV